MPKPSDQAKAAFTKLVTALELTGRMPPKVVAAKKGPRNPRLAR